MKKIVLSIIIILIATGSLFAQKGTIFGIISDANTGETLIGANIVYGQGKGVSTDANGKFTLQLPYGDYTFSISYAGYLPETRKVKIGSKPYQLDVKLKTTILDEVRVVADIARVRETPVAFTNVLPTRISEQIAGRDIPMMLNSTPGVYATQTGGGDGDARITIRGFSARNVGVLLDGVPVNDMENGLVYWSNWFGLDAVTRNIQIQRGLGASKLALPSVGGTINIITRGIEERRGGSIKQEMGDNGYLSTSFGYNSGKLKHGWGITAAGTYKQGDGWVDKTWTKAYFLYVKVDKFIGKHIISFSAYGAPQSHGQRSYNMPAACYSTKWAREHGIDSADLTKYKSEYTFGHGLQYNQHWGTIEEYQITNYGKPNADTTNRGHFKDKNERINEYFKPQLTLKDFWNVNQRLSISNIAYMSIGSGGGIRSKKTMALLPNGEMDFQTAYDYNSFHRISKNDSTYSSTLQSANNYLIERKNNHLWVGALSTFNFKFTDDITMAGGIDLRTYKGIHYEEIYDLLGGDYVIDNSDQSANHKNPDGSFNYQSFMKKVGDKLNYYNDGLVRWGGFFYQAEYKKDRWNAFINLTGARTGYKRVDHFKIDSLQETAWKWINGYTIKGGANYNITSNLGVFINLGYLNKAPRFSNVFDNSNLLFRDIKNEKVKAIELGVNFSTPKFSANLNVYYTQWDNRPVDYAPYVSITDSIPDPNNPGHMIAGQSTSYSANINGLKALHKGVELEFAWNICRQLKLQGLASIGDWIWNSADSVRVHDDYGKTILVQYVNAKGLHVGDAAQIQLGGELRYEPIKDLYFSGNVTYFDKYYANFDPMSYDASNSANASNFDAKGNPVDPWKIPAYYLVDFHAGYSYKIFKNYRLQFRANLINAFDELYVSDADDNSKNIGQTFNSHDARSAAVFFGLGRRYTASIALQF